MEWKKIVLDGVEYYLVPVERPAAVTPLVEVEGLPGIARNALIEAGITHLEHCLDKTEAELLRMPYVGRKALNAISGALAAKYGMRAGQYR